MKLKRFLLRYYPPGIILEFEQAGELKTKSVDLLTLTPETDVEVLVNQVVRTEPLISENRKPQVRKLIQKLVEKIESQENQNFYPSKSFAPHSAAYQLCFQQVWRPFHHRLVRSDMQAMEYAHRRGAAHARGPQECCVRDRIQQPLRR